MNNISKSSYCPSLSFEISRSKVRLAEADLEFIVIKLVIACVLLFGRLIIFLTEPLGLSLTLVALALIVRA